MTWSARESRELAADKAERAPISQSRGKRGVVGLESCLRQKLKVEVARSESSCGILSQNSRHIYMSWLSMLTFASPRSSTTCRPGSDEI